VDVRIPSDRAAGAQQPFQHRAVTCAQQFGRLVLAAATGADLPQEVVDQLPRITRFDPHTGVRKDLVLPADQVSA
jgi:hypothetical protein